MIDQCMEAVQELIAEIRSLLQQMDGEAVRDIEIELDRLDAIAERFKDQSGQKSQ